MPSFSKNTHFDIAIIGGGVIGGMAAFFLRQQGCNVVVLEKNNSLAQEASMAGGGIISPLHPWRYSSAMLDLAAWSHEKFPTLVHQLASLSGVDIPLIKTGMLVPNTNEAEAALNCSFLTSKVLSPKQVFSVEPGIAAAKESVFVEDVHNVRNPALCKALPIALEKLGIEVKTNTHIESIQKNNAEFYIKTQSSQEAFNEKLTANKVVVCAGAWSSELFSLFDINTNQVMPEVFPVKGQMLAIKAKLGVLRTVILEHNRYLIPRHDGIVLVGSTVENSGFNQQTTQEAKQELLAFAYAMLPALQHYPVISHWSGLRPGSHRDRPYICEMDEVPGVYLNTGHFRNGLLSAPASAKVLSDIMLNQRSPFDLDSYTI